MTVLHDEYSNVLSITADDHERFDTLPPALPQQSRLCPPNKRPHLALNLNDQGDVVLRDLFDQHVNGSFLLRLLFLLRGGVSRRILEVIESHLMNNNDIEKINMINFW